MDTAQLSDPPLLIGVDGFDNLMEQCRPLILKYLSETSASDKVVERLPLEDPVQFQELLLKHLSPPNIGLGCDGIIPAIEFVLKYSVHTVNPRFMDKLYSGADPIGAIADFITSLLNCNVHVYQVSPVFSLLEEKLLAELSTMAGLGHGSGGVMNPGGAYSNLLALITARNKKFPNIAEFGLHALPAQCVLFTSNQSHFSIEQAAMTSGIGRNNVISVSTNSVGQMIPEALEAEIIDAKLRGQCPFFVNATAGTTVLGAFDPFQEIADICNRHKLWMHIDGSWGGSLIFTSAIAPSRRAACKGFDHADSITVNPHKMLGVPLLCPALMFKRRDDLLVNAIDASYLYHNEGVRDLGSGTLGCGRRADAFKLGLCWMYHGTQGFGNRVNRALEMANYFVERIRSHEQSVTTMDEANIMGLKGSFELVLNRYEFTNVCFWYFPPKSSRCPLDVKSLRTTDAQKFYTATAQITKRINRELKLQGKFMVDFASLELGDKSNLTRLPPFWRLIINHPGIQKSDLNRLMQEIDDIGAAMEFNDLK